MKFKKRFPIVILLFGYVVSFATVSAAESLNTPLKVMSFNIRNGLAKDGDNAWPLRTEFVVETIRSFDPDLLGLQEAHGFQTEYIQEQLPEYGFFGIAREADMKTGEYVPVMYKKDRFQVVETAYFWLSETPDVPGSKSWDSALPRITVGVRLIDKQSGGKEFGFGNTHWDHRGTVARLESAKLTRKRIERIMQDIPVIMVGDFNTHEDAPPYAALINPEGNAGPALLDTYRVIHPDRQENEGTFSAFTGRRSGNRIDWIITTPDITTLNAAINYTQDNGRYPSDHYPVEAIVRLP